MFDTLMVFLKSIFKKVDFEKNQQLIISAKSLDPDQAQQNVRPDLDPKLFDSLVVFLKEFFKKVDFEKISC